MRKLPINITLFLYKNGETVYKTSKRLKSKIPYALTIVERTNGKNSWDLGSCKIWYDKPNDFYNEFEFKTKSEFKEKFDQCFEPALLRHVGVA